MNNVETGDVMYQDNIHPPDLILHNPSSIPSPDSPLSTPPDSPRRVIVNSNSDVKDEEKKEEDQDDAKALKKEEVPLGESFDEVLEETEKADVGENQSAPDDKKEAPTCDEVMTPRAAIQTTTSDHLEVVVLKPVVVNAKHAISEDDNSNCSHDEPPSLSLVEKAKEKLSRQGLSFTESDSEGALSPSSKTRSPSKIEKEKEIMKSSGDEANKIAFDEVGVDEPPPLSRVEEAMQRTSIMVKKHNQRDRIVRNKSTPTQSVDKIGFNPMTSATSTANTNNASKSSESKLVALQRDIMSLKSSLSDMNMQLKEDQIRVPRIDKYNNTPFTTTPAGSSPSQFAHSIEGCETSFEQTTAVTNDNVVVNRITSHVVPYADDDDEIMKGTKNALSNEKSMDLDVTMETTESSLSQDKFKDARYETLTSHRQMTPKKDLQGSDKGARWLQEELRRRAGMKREINGAIEARGQYDLKNDDLSGHRKPAVDILPSISSPPGLQNSQSTMDEEVAAITANDERNLSTSNQGVNLHSSKNPPSLSKTDTTGKVSRKLEYGDLDNQPHDETMDELMGPKTASETYQGFKPVFNYQDIQHEMKKFASQTREALREQSFTNIVEDPSSKAVPVAFSSSISANRSLDYHTDFQMNAIANIESAKNAELISINFAAIEAGEVPKMLISMDSFDGIASGDIFLSLLSENTGRDSTSTAATWADRVHGAIWRARRMRKSNMQATLETQQPQPIVRGGSQTIESLQKAALMHLKRNEIDDAINIVEGIVFAYYSYFERSLNLREKNPALATGNGAIDFKPYIGMALHNLGVLNLLKGDYDEALSYFARAVENRKSNLGEDHPHYISSLVRLAVCRYALNEFAEAHAGLEEALACAKRKRSTTLEGRLQVAEILNNLGCLAYMSGQPATASSYYRDSMDMQFGALTDSLYLGNAISGQSISLNISIARANIGFIKLVTKELSVAITALENALMEQQILLRGLDDTLIATMDHLALSNLLVGSQEKAGLMYNRILTLQQREYGPNDRRCFVTVEKMNMVQGKGIQYEGAIEELRKTFSVQPASPASNSSQEGKKAQKSPSKDPAKLRKRSSSKTKKKKGLKALTSMMKKNP